MSAQGETQPATGLDAAGKKRIVQVLAFFLLEVVLMFVAAGRLNWTAAWIYIGLRFGSLLILGLWAARKNPGIVSERGRSSENTKSWDKVFGAIYLPLLYITPIVAGLDGGRFGWSDMSLTWQVIGFIGMIPAVVLPYWAMAENPFMVTTVRIQKERGQRVISTGPYRYVRHPMYVGGILLSICGPLLLRTWWALISGGLAAIAIVVRTALEDRTLRMELPGYEEFTNDTRYRLLPGVW